MALSKVTFESTEAQSRNRLGFLLFPRINSSKSSDILKVFCVARNQRKIIDQSSSRDDGIRQFYFVLFAYVSGLEFE